jgi:REP element-mobilizing transposase RayT
VKEMPRQARRQSESGIYHIMLRGINQQQIFEDEEDNEKFIEVLKVCKLISEYKIYAYCLMGNHLHLLLKVEKENLEQIFKRIGARYVYWYNWKYRRKGHLFQDRFKSEPVDDDPYFLAALRYIHQNPVKAGIGRLDYKYSSYNEYINKKVGQLTDIDFVFEMIGRDQFISFNNEANEDEFLDLEIDDFRLTDAEAREIIFRISKCKTVAEFQGLDIEHRDKYLRKLKESGISIRQTSRLTGVSKGIVEKM